jgi:transcriptional regulator with XRE-family HTH domain
VNPQERFAVNLRRARLERGLSQEELGFLCDLHRTEVSLLERAGREPRLGTIVKLAGALETTPQALCDGLAWLPKPRRFEVKPPSGGQ